MEINVEALKPFASLLIEKGFPLLAQALLGPVGGSIASVVMPALAKLLGLSDDASVEEVHEALSKDTDASAKLAAVQEQHSELLDMAKLATDANQAALALEPSFWGRLYVGGWRPAMGWTGVFVIWREIGHYAMVKGPLPFETLSLIVGLWCGLAGIRGVEMVKGVARNSLATVVKKVVRRG